MRAMLMTDRGGPDVLQAAELPTPTPGAGEVLIRVRAVALNHLDLWVRRGVASPQLALPHLLGSDVAGEVAGLGPGVSGLDTGQRVLLNPGVSCGHCEACLDGHDNLCRHYQILGEHRAGGYAESLLVPRANVLPIPPGLSFEQAAALPLSSLTAFQMVFTRGQVRPWHTVLVMAAASGVGVYTVQLCKLAGARVIAVAGGPDKLALARELGADELIDHRQTDYGPAVKALTGGAGVDVAFDHTGAENWQTSLKVLKWGGRLVTCGATSGYEAVTPLAQVFFRQLQILGSTMGSKADLFKVLRFVQEGRLRPVVGGVLPLAQAAQAHRQLEGRQVAGKLVLTV